MADEIRELLKAAQAAEIRGDKPLAIAHLLKVAALYEGAGKADRAVQMLRHAQRIDGARRDVAEELERLAAPRPAPRGVGLTLVSSEPAPPEPEPVERPESEPEQGARTGGAERTRPKRIIERGPTRADPTLEAWCSFCCRPKAEVGELVAGPAGAFICASCVRESARLLGAQVGAAPERIVAPVVEPVVSAVPPVAEVMPAAVPGEVAFGPVALVGQREATEAVQAALGARLGWILVIGPAGSGKSTCLAELERQGLGHRVQSLDELPPVRDGKVLLLDGLERLGAPAIEELCARAGSLGVPVVLALRGDDVAPAATLESDEDVRQPIFSTQALVDATGGALPISVAERIQAVAPFRAQDRAALLEIGRRLVAARSPSLTLSADALGALVAEAARSPRGGHELKALIARLPAGNWGLKAPPRPSRPTQPPRRKGRR